MHLYASEMIKGAMGLTEVMQGARDTTIALDGELSSRQEGMAGDDDAGRHFSKVYKSAASATLDQLGFSAYVLGQTGAGLMRTAREFVAQDSHTAASIMGQQQHHTAALADPSDGCDRAFLHRGQELPHVVRETGWTDKWIGKSDRFRGDPDKVRDVAGSWRKAGKLIDRLLESAQGCARTANKAHGGEAADAFDRYFKRCVGFDDPPQRAQGDETLVANLVAACHQLAKACDTYAEHIDAANREISTHQMDPLAVDNPFDDPKWGGNGYDGGLNDAVLEDPHIHQLGDVAHALDRSQARVNLPKPQGPPGPGLPFVPFPPPSVPAPVPVMALASAQQPKGGYAPVDPSIPQRDPIPPDPNSGHSKLSPQQQSVFRTWMNSLQSAGFGNRRGASDPENAYQLRTAGYPERELPLPPEARGASGKGMMADGIRPSDGYAVDAKYTREEKCGNTFRTLDEVDKTLANEWKVDHNGERKWNPRIDNMYQGDAKEMNRYQAALDYPPNGRVRGLDIVVNDDSTVPYWQTMMALHKVKGDARNVP